MDLKIYPSKLSGDIDIIPSKSLAHRYLICSAFADKATFLHCPETNLDIEVTAACLRAIGVNIVHTEMGYLVTPASVFPASAVMNCGECGTTLRFLLPVVCALGIETTFEMSGRLPLRPLSPLWEELERMGCRLTRPTSNTIHTQGKLKPGTFTVSGNVSSQFISGLLFAAAIMDGKSCINITGVLESKPYVKMSQIALAHFGILTYDLQISGSLPFHSPGNITIEGDWSNGAFFLVANALGNNVNITNLCDNSPQGDSIIIEILTHSDELSNIYVANFPDLVPILAVLFGTKRKITFSDIARLRLKESDRVESVCNMLKNLGACTHTTDNTLTIYPGTYHSCTIDAVNDHRIAMASAIAATLADGPVTILGAECVSKSYPAFWQEYRRLGGKYEQYIR